MGIFNRETGSDAELPPIEQARVAVEAIDIAPHVDRLDSIKLAIAAKEKARAQAQERLQEVHRAIGEARQPDGDAIALALLRHGEMPAVAPDLEREKDQLVAGIAALNRQINEDYYPLREPWNGLKDEISEAMDPLIDELYRRAQEIIGQVETLYAASAALSRLTRTSRVDKLRQFSGTMLASGREFRRFFDFLVDIPVDPALLAFNQLPAVKAMRYGLPVTVAPPSQLQMERDGL
ncbi:hypothetical protein DM806_05005 [Sphingobium lactosutens]|uniref:hypothetical protein n=1 Tax=Sphingobium lactosutens TaxID=522773 RepID=UPI0015B965C1|nr:hypothetical protein [Sphingobium lactosutens]NWK95034.1 hypothetical protein [Sphingobium lactosutens]